MQKGGVPGVTSCLKHGNMICEAIQKAKIKKDMDVIWLDLANAYGLVAASDDTIILKGTYFDGFHIRFTTKGYITNWNKLEVGIAMGCSVPPILFVLAMQRLLKTTENNVEVVELSGGCQMPPVQAFMDDTTILPFKESITCKMLSLMDEPIIWCKMKFKPKRSRSLYLGKGKVNQSINFKVGGQRIPTVSEESVKSLGRWFDESLKSSERNIRTLQGCLHKIDRCPLQ